jgi:hypothetical protein
MLDEEQLREALGRLLPAGASTFRTFVVRDAVGRMRIGTLCTDAGWYAEVSNFQVPPRGGRVDYCAEWEDQPGVFRFGCDVDLFYSDIEQTMSMSQAAAEAALAAVGERG